MKKLSRWNKSDYKKLGIIGLIILFLIGLFTDWIIFAVGEIDQSRIHFFAFQFTIAENPISSILFTILVSYIFSLYLNCIGIGLEGLKSWKMKLYWFLVIIILLIFGIQNLGLRISLHIALLENWYSFETNTVEGILFITENIVFFMSIYMLTFISESNRTE